MSRVRFATYNIQYGFGQDGDYDLDRVADAVFDADIICLQEVTTHWQVCNRDHQPDVLAGLLNRYAVYGSGYELDSSSTGADGRIVNTRRGFGNMVLSRWPVLYSRMHSLPRPVQQDVPDTKTDLPRCALETVIDVPGLPLRVVSVHLSHQSRAQRLDQISVLRSLLLELPGESPLWKRSRPPQDPWSEGGPVPPVGIPTVLGGDFNFEPDDPEYEAMVSPPDDPLVSDAWPLTNPIGQRAKTCVESDGSRTILDYTFVTPQLTGSVAASVVRTDREGSDHFPLLVDLDLDRIGLPVSTSS